MIMLSHGGLYFLGKDQSFLIFDIRIYQIYSI